MPDDEKERNLLNGFYGMKDSDRTDLALACLARPELERRDDGFAILREKRPDAPDDLLHTATFHLYWKLPEVLRDAIAQIELSLRQRDPDLHWGVVSEALHHLYCWVQVDAVLPWGKKALWDELEEVRDCLKNDDRDGAMATLTQLIRQINAEGKEPEFE